jgi:hypothetical protein
LECERFGAQTVSHTALAWGLQSVCISVLLSCCKWARARTPKTTVCVMGGLPLECTPVCPFVISQSWQPKKARPPYVVRTAVVPSLTLFCFDRNVIVICFDPYKKSVQSASNFSGLNVELQLVYVNLHGVLLIILANFLFFK